MENERRLLYEKDFQLARYMGEIGIRYFWFNPEYPYNHRFRKMQTLIHQRINEINKELAELNDL